MTGDLANSVGQSLTADSAEDALWLACRRGDPAARDKLFSLHFPFARQIATREFMRRRASDIEFSDLCQMASVGLLEAIDRFDPGYGAPFQAYANRRVTGAIIDGLNKLNEVREQISFRRRTRRERVASLRNAKTDADPLDVLIELAVGLALGFMLEGTALYVEQDEPVQQANAYDSLAWKETLQRMAAAVGTLPEREQNILRRHYFDGLGFDQIGAILGVTKGRVSQLHRAALALLKKRLLQTNSFTLKR
jgi:RNA polymerase sigma factor for flagellar operon FliA